MRSLLLTLCVLLVLLALVSGARPRDKKKQNQKQPNPAIKIFEFLDKKKEGKIPVDEAKSQIQKMLPLSDDKTIDADNDGLVTLPEFRQFFTAQYREWKANHLKKN